MSTRPKHPCATPRCPVLIDTGAHCHRHTRERERERGSAAHRGYDRRHRRWRTMVLARHPFCPCGQLATQADHILPLKDGGSWALENGQGLCRTCHSQKTYRENHPPRGV